MAPTEFLCTKRAYADFVLRIDCKLTANCNAGIQIRSHRLPASSVVCALCGYQADMSGSGGFWGSLMDEYRRGKLPADKKEKVRAVVKHNDWNQYEIRCIGPRIQLFVNGVKTRDYIEKDEAIVLTGLIGLQRHGGNVPREVRYRKIEIAELP